MTWIRCSSLLASRLMRMCSSSQTHSGRSVSHASPTHCDTVSSFGPESVTDWLYEAANLRQKFQIWDMLEGRDRVALRRIFRWKDGMIIAVIEGDEIAVTTRSHNPEWLNRLKPGDVFGAAKLYLAFQVSTVLTTSTHVGVRLDSDLKLRPYLRPINLLRALWVMFGDLLTGARLSRPCGICGRLMDVTNRRRQKRVHDRCSGRNRTARYRAGKRSAGGSDST